MKKHVTFRSAEASEFYREIKNVAENRPIWSVWSDWIEASALVISIASEFRLNVRAARVKRFQELLDSYKENEQISFDRMFDLMVEALERQPEQDFLGTMFETLGLSDHWKGQFFTPYDVSYMMATINLMDTDVVLEHQTWTDVFDPCSGAGVLLIASRNFLLKKKIGCDRILFVGQDIDKVAGLMGYIQISLLGCAGYIAIGNSLTDPLTWNGTSLIPNENEHYELWFTPMYRSPVWEYRRAKELLKLEAANNNKYKDNAD